MDIREGYILARIHNNIANPHSNYVLSTAAEYRRCLPWQTTENEQMVTVIVHTTGRRRRHNIVFNHIWREGSNICCPVVADITCMVRRIERRCAAYMGAKQVCDAVLYTHITWRTEWMRMVSYNSPAHKQFKLLTLNWKSLLMCGQCVC